jgi:hypothetical protein
VVVEDSDWRTMIALAQFRLGRGANADPGFAAWLKRTCPLTSLKSLRTILNLDRRDEPKPGTPGGLSADADFDPSHPPHHATQ